MQLNLGRPLQSGNNPVSTAETAKAIGASLDTAMIMQAQRRSVVQFTEKGFMSVAKEEAPDRQI